MRSIDTFRTQTRPQNRSLGRAAWLLTGASVVAMLASGAAHAQQLSGLKSAMGIPTSSPAAGTGAPQVVVPGLTLTPAQTQQRADQSSRALDTAVAAMKAQLTVQANAHAAAVTVPSTVHNGLGAGGLVVDSHAGTDPSLWLNAKAPTQTTGSDGKTTVEIDQTASKAILTWDSFDVGKDTTVYFNQSKGTQTDGSNEWIALNRINDTDRASQIQGQIKAEGSVYLINRNGIVFTGTSQVNTHSLIASALPFMQDLTVEQANKIFLTTGIADPLSLGTAATLGSRNVFVPSEGNVTIEAGANIETREGGFSLFVGNNVSNAGNIVSNGGQTILFGGTGLSLGAGDGKLGLIPYNYPQRINGIDPNFKITNTGSIIGLRSDITLMSDSIIQQGVVMATTSITRPGSIHISANAVLATGQTSGGLALFGPDSLTAILPDANVETTSSSPAADDVFEPGEITVDAISIWFQHDSTLYAPGAKATLTATGIGTMVVDGMQSGRFQVDDGALLSVAGLADVQRPMSDNIVTIPRIGQNELADSPLQREGILYRSPFTVDGRDSGTRADGLSWVGTPVANVGGYIQNQPRSVSQMLVDGGTLAITAGSMVLAPDATLDVSGGYTHYLGGSVLTTRLIGADGRIYDASNADPLMTYVSFAGQTTVTHSRWAVSETYSNVLMGGRYESDYLEGGKGGALSISAQQMVLAGALHGDTVIGRYQIGGGNEPKAASLSLTANGLRLSADGTPYENIDAGTTFYSPEWLALKTNDIDNILWTPNISTQVINDGGFGSVSLKAEMITVDADAALTVQPGGSISMTAARMDVLGKLTAHAGTIALTSTGITGGGAIDAIFPMHFEVGAGPVLYPDITPNDTDEAARIPLSGDITIGSSAVLDVSGLWVNDTGAAPDQGIGNSFINGGKINLTTNAKIEAASYYDPATGRPAAGKYYDTTGNILLKQGSLLDASGGGYVDTSGKIAMKNGIPLGKGGDIGLTTYAKSTSLLIGGTLDNSNGTGNPITNGRVEFGGTLKGYGFSGGGTLSLQVLQLQIGGDASGLPDYATYLSQDWFADQGFGGYKLSAVYSATIADGATINVSQRNYIADMTKLATLATGGDIASVSTLGTLDPYHRQATNFALSAGAYLTWDARFPPVISTNPYIPNLAGVTGSVTLGEGASILADAGADVSLSSYDQVDVLGSITAHGGSVEISGLRNNGLKYDFSSRSVWLGKDSLIDVSGIALIDPFAKPIRTGDGTQTPVSGVVLDGGSVTIQGNNAFVVAEDGSRIDASGAKAVLDIRTPSANPFAPIAWQPTEVASDGGSIMLGSSNGLYYDGTLSAAGGSTAARGGTLQIAAVYAGGTTGDSPPVPVASTILLQQSGALVTSGMTMGGAIEGGQISETMHFAADRLNGSGIDTLVLGGDPTRNNASYGTVAPAMLDTIAFSGDVNLSLDRAVMMNAHTYVGANDAKVSINAAYVALAGGGFTDITPALAAGSGTLDVNARQIDLMGQFTLQHFADANFTSSGDIRLMMPAEIGYINVSKVERPGELITAGDLTFKAGQIYPATGNVFILAAPTAGSTITFLGNGSVAPPISAGGALLVDAAHIIQDGTIRAPSGTIQLGIGDITDASIKSAFNNLPLVHTDSVTLGAGSLTSVSLDGRSLPYGSTTDGKDWALVVQNSNGTKTTLDPLKAPPEKLIGLAGDTVDFGQGATVDLSGGGNLYAQEFVPGTGGSRDLLNAVNTTYSSGAAAAQVPLYADGREVYAVVPGYQAPVAAYDPSFGYPGKDMQSSLGKAVYLSGVPGLPDGVYTLLPGEYATMPGAFRVVQQTQVTDSISSDNLTLADGSNVVSGRFVDALTGKSDARSTSFLVQSQDVWKQYSEYTITPADTYFPGQAAHAGTTATRTPVDAGRLVLAAVNDLILDGVLNAKAGKSDDGKAGRGAAVDISAQAIQILGGSGVAQNGYLQVDATSLSNLGAESLLIGGTRSDGPNGTTINATATNVLLSNDSGSALTGPEVMLVTKAGGAGLVLESGSALAAKGDMGASTAPILIGKDGGASGDGALVRVSNGGAISVIRDNVPGLGDVAGTATGLLDIRDGASIQGGKSTILDSTGNLLLDPGASFSGDAIDVNANTIAFLGDGSTASPTGFVVGDALLAQLATVGTLGLHSRSTMTFYGDVDLATKQSLVLGANAFASDGGKVTITAPSLTLTNDVGGGGATFTGGTGTLTLNAGELDLGAGSVTVQGFGSVNATATQGIVGQRNGSFDFGNLDVTMTAPVFTADSGANTSVKTTGALTLNRGAGTAITRETLGGALSLSGGNLTTNATITASAGNVTLAATTGDLTLQDGALISVKGYSKTFFDTEAYAPGGNLSLTASNGGIKVGSGATLDVSGSDKGGDAGGLTLNASGAVTLDGTLKGKAASDDYRGGRLTLASGSAIDLDRIADLTQAAGFNSGLSVTSGAGNLVLSAGKTLTGQVIYLAANGGDRPGDSDGNLVINGTIDVSGEAAGHIDLFGKSGVDVAGKLLATSSVAHQDGGVVTIGTTGVTDGGYNGQYGYETVQAADSGSIRLRNGALIDVSGGSSDAGGQVSFRAPLLSDGDVKIAIAGGNANIKGAGRVTIEPYAKWSASDTTTGAQHFDGIIDPAGWYGADGTLVAGQWTDDKGKVLDAPADDAALKVYLSKYYFTPTAANTDHTGFYGYKDGDAAQGPGTLMGFVQAPGFSFGSRYATLANVHVRPGMELANPGETVNGGNISVLTNWNLGAGETGTTGGITLAYRFGNEAPVLTVRAEHSIDLEASITDGFYQQNDGAHLQDAPPADGGSGDAAYDTALLSYSVSKNFLDSNGLWNGTINLVGGGTANITADPNYQALQAPLSDQTANYYANYMSYIGEVGTGDVDNKWADNFFFQSQTGGFLNYSPDASPNGDTLKSPADFATYADYAAYYQTWLTTWFDTSQTVPGSGTDTTPIPLQLPVDSSYTDYSHNYQQVYIPGHNAYDFYVLTNVGIAGSGTQLFYAPFAPRSDAAGSLAYQAVLASYRLSKEFLDRTNIWTGSIKLATGDTVDISADPYYEPIRAPLLGQTDAYYGNYQLYIDEIGDDSTRFMWGYFFNDQVQNKGGFSPYAPTPLVAPQPADFDHYSDYELAYENWLSTSFVAFEASPTTPSPLLAPIATDYGQYSSDYSIYIGGHLNYLFNVSFYIANFGADSQLFYAPFSPRSDPLASGGGTGVTVPIAQPGPNNSPSNMPIAGRPVSLASATLLGGESSSFRFVAGADFGAADALSINRLTGTGSVALDGHFEVVDTATTDDDGNPLPSPTANQAVGQTVLLPNVIRTGTGTIDIAAADDITLTDPRAPGAIYTAGKPVGASSTSTAIAVIRPGMINSNMIGRPTFLATPVVQPDNGGDITLTAGGDILGNQEIYDVDGQVTGTIGRSIAQYWYPWLNSGLATDAATSINFANFDQGVLSAGGNVSVLAGGDIRELSVSLPTTWYLTGTGPRETQTVNTVGGGNLSVEAGGDILAGTYFIAKGTGRIDAGGSIGSAFSYQSLRDAALINPVSTILAMEDAQVQVTARGDLDIGRVINPGQITLDRRGLSVPFLNTLDQITPGSSLQLTSVNGDVGFNTLNAPGDFILAAVDTLLPATLKVNALGGGITIADLGMLFPSATGQLSLLANDTVRLMSFGTIGGQQIFGLSQAKAAGYSSILNPIMPGDFNGGAGTSVAGQLDSIDGLLHDDDADPVRIYSLTGDIISGINSTKGQSGQGVQTNQLWLQTPKATQIRAGRDIIDLIFLGQNLHDSDVTSIVAGRDIIDTPRDVNVIGGIANGLIQLAGPGKLDIQAGRDLGPLDHDVPDSSTGGLPSTGIQTIGNRYNAYLPRESADISVLFGTGPGVAWDTFAAAYLDPAATGTGLPSFNNDLIAAVAKYQADTSGQADGALPALSADQAWAAFKAMPEAQRNALIRQTFFKILAITGADVNDPNSPNFGKYARGYQAIEILFPSALGYTKNNLEGGENGAATQITTGNLDIRGSTIQTQMGGNIDIMGPGGQLLIGSASSPSYVPGGAGGGGIGPQSQGILAWQKGQVNIFSDQSVLLAQSRIFTQQGGDMTIWSSNGDVNAGKGVKTSSEIRPVGYFCTPDGYCRIDSASQVTGAGIAAFPAVPGDPSPTVTLAAPRGTVDAGDAGIRVSGNLVVAAQFVANADNIQVSGKSFGLPPKPVTNLNLTTSDNSSHEATQLQQTLTDQKKKQRRRFVTVELEGLGLPDDSNNCDPKDTASCKPKQ